MPTNAAAVLPWWTLPPRLSTGCPPSWLALQCGRRWYKPPELPKPEPPPPEPVDFADIPIKVRQPPPEKLQVATIDPEPEEPAPTLQGIDWSLWRKVGIKGLPAAMAAQVRAYYQRKHKAQYQPTGKTEGRPAGSLKDDNPSPERARKREHARLYNQRKKARLDKESKAG